ncbi:MAG: hypothetical protein HZA28_02085 [Candidatus Omnitrophica bacterium]|nr:hypothetical protein [Candidatus Omnitrophota bacterium]
MGRTVFKRFFFTFRKLFGSPRPSSKRKLKNKRSDLRRTKVKKRSLKRPSRKGKVQKKKVVFTKGKTRGKARPVPAKRKGVPAPSPKVLEDPGQLIGEVTHFFSRIQVVVVKMKKGTLSISDKIRVRGAATDFTQAVGSMQIESVDVKSARNGQVIGLKVVRPARAGDRVYKMPA